MFEISLGVITFTGIVLALVSIILAARSRLVPTGEVTITVNEQRTIHTPVGLKLLGALSDAHLYVSSACGGGGTCGQCRVTVFEGGGAALPTETNLLSRRDINAGARLACQIVVKNDMRIEVPREVFGVKRLECTVRHNHNVATYIKEIVLELPENEQLDFRAGGYVLTECPPHHIRFADFDIGEQFREDWDRLKLWNLESRTTETTTRAYSMANYPEEKGIVMLNIRIALAPPGSDSSVPPGIMSSYLFSLKPGDKIMVSGPYGEFFARETDAEMVFVGGGAGMAPMRAHILDQLKRLHSARKMTFWYGARSRRELFYVEEFDQLQRDHANFSWNVALSEPLPEDHWDGPTGFIHRVLYDNYLKDHPAPEECEYYLCGPPMMTNAVIAMLTDLGVEPENILLDDFGG